MAERRVTDVVREGSRFDDFRVDSAVQPRKLGLLSKQALRGSARNLRNLECVREPIVEYVPFDRLDNLSHAREASERECVEDSVSITLEF